jgi:hypothetical protein
MKDDVVLMTWTAHPARDQRGKAVAAIVVMVAMAWLVHGWVGVPGWGTFAALASFLVLLLALNRFFLPTTFSIDKEGITARYPLRQQRLSWGEVRRFLCDQYGGYLSRRQIRSRMDGFSGMHITFGDHQEDAEQMIRRFLPQEVAP